MTHQKNIGKNKNTFQPTPLFGGQNCEQFKLKIIANNQIIQETLNILC